MKISNTGYKRTSKDKNEPGLIIPSNHITMKDVDFPVMGIDNTGYSQMMYPGMDYIFPGSQVYETPAPQSYFGYGGDISIPDLRRAQIGLSVPSNSGPFGNSTSEFYEKWNKPTSLVYDKRATPTIEKEEALPVSYRRNMGEITTKGIQEKLKRYDPSLEADGVWGPLTETAYRKYWNKHLEDKGAEAKAAIDFERAQAAQQELNYYRPGVMPREAMGPQSFSEPMSASEKWRMRSQGDNMRTLIEQAEDVASSNMVNVPGQATVDFYSKENPVTGKPLRQYSREELIDYINNSGARVGESTVSEQSPDRLSYKEDLGEEEDRSVLDYAKHYYDILSDPFKAARMSRTEQYNPFGDLVLNVPDVPFGFANAEEDSTASAAELTGSALSAFNPLTYLNAAGRLAKGAIKANTYYDLANLSGAAGKSFLGAVSGDDLPISDEQKESAFRGLNTVMDALTVAPMVAEAKPFVKGFSQGSLPSALQRFTSYAITPSAPLTQIEKSSLTALRKASNILAQNKIGASPGVSKSTMKMIVADPKLLSDFQTAVKELHPNVVRKLIGNQNFNEFSKHFKTTTKGLGVEEITRAEKLGLGLQNKGYLSLKKPSAGDMDNPLYKAGYNLIKPNAFTENFELEKMATTLVPQMHATDKNVISKLRDAFNKVDAAEPGELFVGSSNMSVDSYAITNNRLVSSLKDGAVKIHDVKMAPLNNQGIATATENKSFYKAALKQVNEEIESLSEKISQNLPKAYYDANSQRIIAPYIVVEKVAAPKLIRVQVKVKTPNGVEKEIKYVKPDLSDLKPNETVIKELPKDYNPRYKPSSIDKYSRGGQSGRTINSYNDFVNIWNS